MKEKAKRTRHARRSILALVLVAVMTLGLIPAGVIQARAAGSEQAVDDSVWETFEASTRAGVPARSGFKVENANPSPVETDNTSATPDVTKANGPRGATLTFNYSRATTGTGYYIAVFFRSWDGKVPYLLFPLRNIQSASGTVSFAIPNDIADGDYQLYFTNDNVTLSLLNFDNVDTANLVKIDLKVRPRATNFSAPQKLGFSYTNTDRAFFYNSASSTEGDVYLYDEQKKIWYGPGHHNRASGRNAGNYNFKFVVVGDATHSDSDPITITSTVGQSPVSTDWRGCYTPQYYNGQQKTYYPTPAFAYAGADFGQTVNFVYESGKDGKATDAGIYTTKITGTGNNNFKFQEVIPERTVIRVELEKQWQILAQPFNGGSITLGPTLTYNGKPQKQTIAAARTGAPGGNAMDLQPPHYTISGDTNTNAGTYTLTLRPTDTRNFSGTLSTQYTIQKLDISKAEVEVTLGTALTYNGTRQTQNVTKVTANGLTLTPGTDYDVLDNTGTDAKTYQLTIRAKGTNFTGEVKKDFTIAQKDITGATTINLVSNTLTYNGRDQKKEIVNVVVDRLVLGSADYTTDGQTARTAGSHTITVTGRGNYKGTATASFNIDRLPVTIGWNGANGLVYDDQEHTVTPYVSNAQNGDTVNITSTSGTLKEKNKGTYTATVTGISNDNYTLTGGTNLTLNWSIANVANQFTVTPSISGWTYRDAPKNPSGAAQFGNVRFEYTNTPGADDGFANTPPTQAGSYYMRAVVDGTENYATLVSEKIPFTIAPLDITGDSQLRVTEFAGMTYNGEPQQPLAQVTYGEDDEHVTGEWSEVTDVTNTTTFNASGNFTGTIQEKDPDMKPKDIGDATVEPAEALFYNGKVQTPKVTVTLPGFESVTYDLVDSGSAINVKTDGDYPLKVEGTGNFTGTATGRWNILPAEPKVSDTKKTTARIYRGKTLADAEIKEGEVLGVDGQPLKGEFAWQDATTKMDADGDQIRIFTPEDTNYAKLMFNVAVVTYSPFDVNYDKDDDGEPDNNVDTDDDGEPDINIDKDGDGEADINIDTDGDNEPDINIDTDDDGEADINIDTDDDGEADINIDTDGDNEPDINIDTDGDNEPDINIDTDGDKKPDINIDTDGDNEPDINIDTDGDNEPDINIDTDGDNEPNINIDTDGDNEPDINIDTDGDNKPDINIDTDGDNKPDINIDTDGDNKPDINIDTDGDNKPELNIDTNGDGKPDLNIDTNGDGKPELNIDTNGDGKPDLNIDTNGDGKPDLNIDIDGDGKPDLNIDTDGDGIADTNIDADGDGIVDGKTDPKNPLKPSKPGKTTGAKTGDNTRLALWVLLLVASGAAVAAGVAATRKKKPSKK